MQILAKIQTYVAISTLLATALGAQTSVAVGPYLGYYRPFGHFEPASVYSVSLPQQPEDLAGPAFGGFAEVWFGRRVGVLVQADVTRSSVGGADTPEGPRGPASAHVESLALQALAGLPHVLGLRPWISGGFGAVRHTGDAYTGIARPWQPAGVVGLGSSIGITKRIALTAGVTTMWYTLNVPMPPELQSNPGSLERGRQIDATFLFGASWTIVPARK